ncbi:S8 family serine peptidase [Micromonospora sp. NPDC005806]|uniref:S8 family peptidase n=1 Tax=Micromonospora sp. NPDC005806 TaxID=3364234 RepID=UPI003684A643
MASALAILTVSPPAFATTVDATPGATSTSHAGAGSGPSVPRTVTLITGDTVTITTAADGTESKEVTGPDGEAVGFKIHQVGKSTYVYPDSALPYVSAGRLDKELFNVTQLLADGYDDAHTDHLPLLVSYTDSAARARAQALPAGVAKVRTLSSIQGAALTESHSHAADFWSGLTGGAGAQSAARVTGGAQPSFTGGIAKVWLDGKVKAALADTTAQIGAPEVWAAGNTGQGVDVAVLDTGVDNSHPDLADRIAGSASFVPNEGVFDDYVGHGTHVASTIAGTGAASDGKEKGVAPGARLHIGKVLGTKGGQDSWVLAGMEWAARDQHAKIINMSLGAGPTDGTDPLSQAVNQLSAETGALFVIAAGNYGAPNTVASPGAADAALTVGAVDSSDQLADFSSQGPRVDDGGLKPEITAPGVDVLAALSHNAQDGDHQGPYRTMSGTSMATPHVTGAAALLAATHPDWTGQQLKDALISSTKTTPQYTPDQAGAGRVDVAAAVRDTVFATGSAYAGLDPWPHQPGEKRDKDVTYTNTADAPVTLNLAINVPDAPAGLFTLSATQVTVPAHGTSKVTYTANLDKAPLDSHFSGMINASDADADGKVLAHTLIGVGKEGENYNLSITAKDRSGNPLSGQLIVVGKTFGNVYALDESGTGTIKLPAGTYAAWLNIDQQGAHGPHSLGRAMLAAPEIVLDRDRAVTLDASKARQLTAVTPKKTVDTQFSLHLFRSFGPDGGWLDRSIPNGRYDSVWALPTGQKVTEGEFQVAARWRKEEPMLTVASGARNFDDLWLQHAATPLPKGRMKLDTVFAGEGADADYAGLQAQGKIAVVRHNDNVGQQEQADAASKAGVRLLLVVNNGTGRLAPWLNPFVLPSSSWLPQVTVATLTSDEGEELISEIQHGPTTLTVDSNPTTDYSYDLFHVYDGAVPDDPTYQPAEEDLAHVNASFRNYQQDRATEERKPFWHGQLTGSLIAHEVPAQGERTEWVSTEEDTQWLEQNIIPFEIQEGTAVLQYKAGSTTDVHWFGPVERPRLIPGRAYHDRSGDSLSASVPAWGDSGPGHIGTAIENFGVESTVKLYQGDTFLYESFADWLDFQGLSPERLPYRLVSENSRGLYWTNPYSTSTRTEWGFTSAAEDTNLPLIQLDYDVNTDTVGKANRNTDLTVTPSHLPGGPSSKAIGDVTLDVSYDDGATWQQAALKHIGDGWKTTLHAPAGATYVTLRASAHDNQSNSITQSITHAFGLK